MPSAKRGAEQLAKIRWAPRLPPRLLERLYESDSKGYRDIELCDDVGLRLYERCRAFLLVRESEVVCPLCRQVFGVSPEGTTRCPGEGCGWFTTQESYWESVRNHYAHTGRAIEAFTTFHRRYPATQSYASKILLIDQLIHSFHRDEATGTPVKSVASKLLEGNKTEVVRFLDRLSSADPSEKDRWRQTMSRTIHGRIVSPGTARADSEEES